MSPVEGRHHGQKQPRQRSERSKHHSKENRHQRVDRGPAKEERRSGHTTRCCDGGHHGSNHSKFILKSDHSRTSSRNGVRPQYYDGVPMHYGRKDSKATAGYKQFEEPERFRFAPPERERARFADESRRFDFPAADEVARCCPPTHPTGVPRCGRCFCQRCTCGQHSCENTKQTKRGGLAHASHSHEAHKDPGPSYKTGWGPPRAQRGQNKTVLQRPDERSWETSYGWAMQPWELVTPPPARPDAMADWKKPARGFPSRSHSVEVHHHDPGQKRAGWGHPPEERGLKVEFNPDERSWESAYIGMYHPYKIPPKPIRPQQCEAAHLLLKKPLPPSLGHKPDRRHVFYDDDGDEYY
eukprot:gnl/MRDRNA2_/MRDRNA2_132023_c0_seq1.p1 gnl/MRDRNA2_/MRDRNA2_132023_c0~~gnl/MRDRNA2_/MRDRNA2_132023_c0_seq1.p1  ORF type:complete len:374 (-),score=51.46 gnl/MRDRNA2_/MRDRNA2_132023_c0_seq1:44-1105(-)